MTPVLTVELQVRKKITNSLTESISQLIFPAANIHKAGGFMSNFWPVHLRSNMAFHQSGHPDLHRVLWHSPRAWRPLLEDPVTHSGSPEHLWAFGNTCTEPYFWCPMKCFLSWSFWRHVQLAVSIGNSRFNDIMEAGLPNDSVKPLPQSDMWVWQEFWFN